MRATIKLGLMPTGKKIGTPTILIRANPDAEWLILTEAEMLEQIVALKIKNVTILGSVTDNPVIKPLSVQLGAAGYKICIITSGKDDIEPLKHIRGSSFIITTIPPTFKLNTINPRQFNVLWVDDEIRFVIDTKAQYEAAKEFLKLKSIQNPTVIFDFTTTFKEKYLEMYLQEVNNFKCPTLVTTTL